MYVEYYSIYYTRHAYTSVCTVLLPILLSLCLYDILITLVISIQCTLYIMYTHTILYIGIKTCILKGIHFEDDTFAIIISHKVQGGHNSDLSGDGHNSDRCYMYRINIPKITTRSFSGCGDLFTATMTNYLYHYNIHNTNINKYTPPADLTPPNVSSDLTPPNLSIDLTPPNLSTDLTPPTTDLSLPNRLALCLEGTADLMNDVLTYTTLVNSDELCIVECADIYINTRNKLRHATSAPTTATRYNTTSAQPATVNSEIKLPLYNLHSDIESSNTDKSINISISNSSTSSTCYKMYGGCCGVIFDMDGTLTEAGIYVYYILEYLFTVLCLYILHSQKRVDIYSVY